MQQSRINPKLSAHNQVFGTFNYQRTPLAPLGTKVIIHKRPDQRKTWDKHGQPEFMVNRAKHHFQSWEVSVAKTGATRVSDAIKLLPAQYTMSKTSSNDRISAAFKEIAKPLNKPKLKEIFLNDNKKNKFLNEIIDIFDRKTVRRPRVSPSPNTKKIAYVPTRVGQLSHSPNTHKIKHTSAKETSGE